MKTQFDINYDADSIEELQEYVNYRNLQLLKFGFTKRIQIEIEEGIVCGYNNEQHGNYYGAIFMLKSHRGKNKYVKILQQQQIAVVTLEECNIESYLKKIKCNHLCFKHSTAYKIIQEYYGKNIANRTKVPLIYHIDEGGYILNKIGASDIVKDAYYLHPILQSDDSFRENKVGNFKDTNTESIILAMEYRRVANSYLSKNKMSDFVGFSCEEVKQMLIADKIQNFKDFMRFHYGTHERSKELHNYFCNWMNLLDINFHDWVDDSYNFIMI